MTIALLAASIASPLWAQNVPAPGQSTPAQAQPAPAQQPRIPRVIPAPVAQAPTPAQSPSGQPGTAGPQTGAAPTAQATPAPGAQGAPAPVVPERRLLPPPAVASGGMVSLNFNRADLIEIIHIIAQHLRLTYTIDPEVKGTVTINSAQPLSSEDLLPIFHQLLRMNGAVAVKTGNLYQIMPIKDGKGVVRPVGQGKEDSFALQVVPVRFFSVAEMKKVLSPFLMPGAEIIENPRGNFLIIMDLPSNIQRLVEIADLIDVQVFAGTRMEIYQPKVASAEELAQELTKVMQSFASSAPQADTFTAQFIPLPRINQLLVISNSEAAWTYARRWLDRIDVVAEGPGRRIFIYAVENGKANELADVISQALGQATTGSRSNTRSLQDLHRSTTGGTTQQQGTQGTGRSTSSGAFGSSGGFGQQSSGSLYATVPVPGQPVAPVAPVPGTPQVPPGVLRPQTAPQQQAKPEEQLRIVPDPATNSLIIYGTAQEFQNIKNILKELDQVPRQVLIDAMVLQVTLADTETFGVDYQILHQMGDIKIFDQIFNNRAQILTGALSAGKLGGISAIVGNDKVKAFIAAVMTDSRAKLLSAPSVLATDNRPARIQVGSEQPVATGSVSAPVTGGVTSSTTVQYRNTGRIMTIIPQVNSMGLVNLEIKAEISAPGASVTVGSDSFPSFDTQDAETTAVVQDGDTLVIGGLIGEIKKKSRTGIPYLMDLPVLGRFFSTTTDDTTRTELIMLITPHVIRNRGDAKQVTQDFKNSLSAVRNELERMARDKAMTAPRMRQDLTPPVPTPVPAPQAPAQTAPAPAPSVAPSGAGASAAPLTKISVLSNVAPAKTPTESSPPSGGFADLAQSMSDDLPAESKAESAQRDAPTIQQPPVYALSAIPTDFAPHSVAATSFATSGGSKQAPLWVVQIAALSHKQDAEVLARNLRKKGYDAYVVATEVNQKTWHRVRVGQPADRMAASSLQKMLKVQQKLEPTLVTRE